MGRTNAEATAAAGAAAGRAGADDAATARAGVAIAGVATDAAALLTEESADTDGLAATLSGAADALVTGEVTDDADVATADAEFSGRIAALTIGTTG